MTDHLKESLKVKVGNDLKGNPVLVEPERSKFSCFFTVIGIGFVICLYLIIGHPKRVA